MTVDPDDLVSAVHAAVLRVAEESLFGRNRVSPTESPVPPTGVAVPPAGPRSAPGGSRLAPCDVPGAGDVVSDAPLAYAAASGVAPDVFARRVLEVTEHLCRAGPGAGAVTTERGFINLSPGRLRFPDEPLVSPAPPEGPPYPASVRVAGDRPPGGDPWAALRLVSAAALQVILLSDRGHDAGAAARRVRLTIYGADVPAPPSVTTGVVPFVRAAWAAALGQGAPGRDDDGPGADVTWRADAPRSPLRGGLVRRPRADYLFGASPPTAPGDLPDRFPDAAVVPALLVLAGPGSPAVLDPTVALHEESGNLAWLLGAARRRLAHAAPEAAVPPAFLALTTPARRLVSALALLPAAARRGARQGEVAAYVARLTTALTGLHGAFNDAALGRPPLAETTDPSFVAAARHALAASPVSRAVGTL